MKQFFVINEITQSLPFFRLVRNKSNCHAGLKNSSLYSSVYLEINGLI